MSEDIYAKPDLTKKVRFQTGENDDRQKDVCDNIDTVRIYDNCWAEESTPQDKSQDTTAEDQHQTTPVVVSSEKRSLPGAAAVFLGLLCLLLLVAVIVLVVVFIQERNRLWGDIANLTNEKDKLQTSYSEMKSFNYNLTQETRQLENETEHLKATNYNLTKMIDELEKLIETPFCHSTNWTMFGHSCYFMFKLKKSWAESKKTCETHDAQLVIISDEDEQKFISSFNPNSWIGLTDDESEDVWKWVDGTKPPKTYWKSAQPDNGGYWGGNEDCAQILNTDSFDNWNDLPCSNKIYFTCEKIRQ